MPGHHKKDKYRLIASGFNALSLKLNSNSDLISLANAKIPDCLSSNTNFRIIQGILINKNIELTPEELICIKSNNQNEKFDYLRESFGAPIFTYSLGSLFCLNVRVFVCVEDSWGMSVYINAGFFAR